MKILAGILMSLYLGLTLFGLYQYKAHNRNRGMKLVVWMSGLVLLVAMIIENKSRHTQPHPVFKRSGSL